MRFSLDLMAKRHLVLFFSNLKLCVLNTMRVLLYIIMNLSRMDDRAGDISTKRQCFYTHKDLIALFGFMCSFFSASSRYFCPNWVRIQHSLADEEQRKGTALLGSNRNRSVLAARVRLLSDDQLLVSTTR
jgi:hypothetical protein